MCYTQICPRFECQDEHMHTIHTCVYCVLTLDAGPGIGVCRCLTCYHSLYATDYWKTIIINATFAPPPRIGCSRDQHGDQRKLFEISRVLIDKAIVLDKHFIFN